MRIRMLHVTNMQKITVFIGALLAILCFWHAAHAGFVITSAIIEFKSDGPRHQDIEIVSQPSGGNQYIVSEINEILNPGQPNEIRQPVKDPTHSMLLVTPDKTVLAEGIGLMRASAKWDDFYRLLQRAFGKKNEQMTLNIEE